ncbi:MAG: MATE family efflux transporter [Defluviitaleaceae bacterium]|nr:MATE family efflux transporter [Defluviitaleaceae bacterium]
MQADTKKRTKELLSLTFPIMVEQSFIMLMGVINTAMVAVLGAHELSAAGHINNSAHIPIALLAATATGGTILVAQATGAKDTSRAKRCAGQSISLAFALSIFLTVFLQIFQGSVVNILFPGADSETVQAAYEYFFYINWSMPFLAIGQTIFGVLRGAGDVKSPMVIVVIMNIINVALSFTLIPILGISGAGIAMLGSRFIGFLLGGIFVLSKKSKIRLNELGIYLPTRSTQKDIFTLGIPTGIENFLFNVGRTLTQVMVVALGTAAMAANVAILNVMNLILIPGLAYSAALMVMVGQRVGKKEVDDIKKTTFFTTKACAISMGILCLAFIPLRGLMANMFHLDYYARVYFNEIYWILILMSPFFWAPSFVIPSALRAVKDVKFSMTISVTTMWIFRVALSYVLIFLGFGVLGVWIGFFGDWIVRSFIFYVRMNREKWIKFIKI